jgi:GNAT superfamily N-acetyltransferase
MIEYKPFASDNADQLHAMTAILNAACTPHLEVPARLVAFNAQPVPGTRQAGRIAMQGEQPVGVILATVPLHPEPDSPIYPPRGWVETLAVLPAFQKQGIGSALLQWAEEWLRDQGCLSAAFASGMRPFAPGLPVELGTLPFFERRGWQAAANHSYDLARTLGKDEPLFSLPAERHAMLQNSNPARPKDKEVLLAFLAREFPGRWWFECQTLLEEGGDISDYILTWTDDPDSGHAEIASFVRLTFEDSIWPVERYYPQRLPRPWGALGTVGTAARLRGHGYSAATIYTGLECLRARGAQSCVIDWTGLIDFYGKFGFSVYREYYPLSKKLS